MENQVVSFKVAKLAQEKGFNEVCFDTYDDKGEIQDKYNIDFRKVFGRMSLKVEFEAKNEETVPYGFLTAPTQSLLQKWLRENHNIHVEVTVNFTSKRQVFRVRVRKVGDWGLYFSTEILIPERFVSYEAGLEEGLQRALEIIVTTK